MAKPWDILGGMEWKKSGNYGIAVFKTLIQVDTWIRNTPSCATHRHRLMQPEILGHLNHTNHLVFPIQIRKQVIPKVRAAVIKPQLAINAPDLLHILVA